MSDDEDSGGTIERSQPTIIISFPMESIPIVQIANANAFQVLLAAGLLARVADQVMKGHEEQLRQASQSPIIRPGRNQ